MNSEISTEEETGPIRTCISCRAQKSKQELLRFVRSPDGGLWPDILAKAPGRGASTCMSKSCWHEAVKKEKFTKVWKKPCIAEIEFLTRYLREQWHSLLLNELRLLYRRQLLVIGFDAVKMKALHTPPALYACVLASDASPRLTEEPIRWHLEPQKIMQWPHSKHEIASICGKDEVAILGCIDPRASAALLRRWNDSLKTL